MSSKEIARAYGALVERGEKVTVRALQKEAKVRTVEAAAWLRDHAPSAGAPEMPDLSEVTTSLLQAVWSAAWAKATTASEDSVSEALEAARRGEASALDEADEARAARAVAEQEAEQAKARAEELSTEVERLSALAAELRQELAQAQSQVADANRAAQQADIERARAEATSDTLREVLAGYTKGGAS